MLIPGNLKLKNCELNWQDCGALQNIYITQLMFFNVADFFPTPKISYMQVSHIT